MSAAVSPEAAPKAKASAGRMGPFRRPQPVNLARRPFANTRHIRRLGIALWVAGALLLALDGWLYWRSLFGIESKKEERAGVDTAITAERERLAKAEEALATIDLERQNFEATFLNARIAERTFPWSALFDQLADVLPKRVRLLSLTPKPPEEQRITLRPRPASTREEPGDGRVYLLLSGVAESDDALLELLDNLFAHAAFDSPQLTSEARKPDGISFAVNVFYLPGQAAAPAPAPTPTPEIVEEAPTPSEAGP